MWVLLFAAGACIKPTTDGTCVRTTTKREEDDRQRRVWSYTYDGAGNTLTEHDEQYCDGKLWARGTRILDGHHNRLDDMMRGNVVRGTVDRFPSDCEPGGEGGTEHEEFTVTYTYDAHGNPETMRVDVENTGGPPLVVSTYYTSFSYTYDAVGSKRTERDDHGHGAAETYTFDADGNPLTAEWINEQGVYKSEAWTYDDHGNPVSHRESYYAHTHREQTFAYSYDTAGRRLTEERRDADGNVDRRATFTYTDGCPAPP